ncbi:MAG: sigma-54-dependent Fis family transcriptional regulator [Planctomycetes bacterium]|nr:sigma-54-dependent Fis family transcriptional regulator [Planctomycetota bacterium]
MQMELPRMGHEVVACGDGRAALDTLGKSTYDAVILDLQMPGQTGIQVLEKAKELSPDTEFIILTGHATLDTAVEALRHGAFDYLTKPCKLADLESRLAKIAEKRQLTNQALALEKRLHAAEGPVRLIGRAPAMHAVGRLIDTVAPTDSTVLILGETGTGKELVASTLHDRSHRAKMPFVPVNCAALPENLVESELFGHRKGAFTGADQHRKGLFEVAHGGTLFLDEVGELDKAIQVKLLRFLESGEVRRVGENEPFRVDVRVVCATNRNLIDMVDKDDFRQDLYFRINTFEIQLPPLRERVDDLAELAQHLLTRRRSSRGASVATLSEEALEELRAYHWPGNVRELANVVEHAAILSGGGTILPEHLPQQLRLGRRPATAPAPDGSPPTLRDIEMEHILAVLEKHQGNKPVAARELGISLKTLYNKLHQLQPS